MDQKEARIKADNLNKFIQSWESILIAKKDLNFVVKKRKQIIEWKIELEKIKRDNIEYFI